ncbi:hypothetical protein MD484_g7227, partial [Candolleomyces efflorescens]
MTSSTDLPWWKTAVVYQIYPISFFDSNGDGVGDLNGITSKLDYLKDLGIDVLWLCPIYRSPLADMGYDISDYLDIDPRYGTLEDWDNLLKGTHERGMKLMMDFVANHSSDEHEWFKESRSDKSNPKRDWYIWRPPRYDSSGKRQPPNNWKSIFQGSAWEYDEKTEEYYLHLYLAKQPDLNWDNAEVRDAVWKLMKFWLDRGCDGFRLDAINVLSKVEGLSDAPVAVPDEPYQNASMCFANGPRIHEYLKEMNENVLSKYDLITVGETPFTYDKEEIAAYVLPQNKEFQMAFQFGLSDIDSPLEGEDVAPLIYKPWKLSDLKDVICQWQTFKRDEGFWNAVFTENHDIARSVSRFGDDSTDEWRTRSAKRLALLQVTQSGTQFIFQGQELGLKNFPRTWGIEEYKDAASQNFWNKTLAKRTDTSVGAKFEMSDVLDNFVKKARDHARVPMQWNASSNAGFTTGTPWMRVSEDYNTWNAENQVKDENSVRAFWKRLLEIRKENDVLVAGDFEELVHDHERVFAYVRRLRHQVALVVLAFGNEDVTIQLDSLSLPWSSLKLEAGNYHNKGEVPISDGKLELKGFEGGIKQQQGIFVGDRPLIRLNCVPIEVLY